MFQVREQEIIFNEKIAGDIYLMKISGSYDVKEGQFFMLKAEDRDMTLFRPISIFDCDSYGVSFLYSVRGKGTEIFSKMMESETMLLHGPYGNGFPKPEGKIAMVAGGIGMAPLYLTERRNPGSDLYIGIRENLYSQEELQLLEGLFEGCSVKFKISGLITEIIDFDKYGVQWDSSLKNRMIPSDIDPIISGWENPAKHTKTQFCISIDKKAIANDELWVANFFFRANTFYFPAQDTIQYLFPSKIKLDKKLAYNDYR